jgi:dTDP-4-dehydrorhamnose reductase
MNRGILIVGVNGLIGSSLARKAEEEKAEWMGTSREARGEQVRELDLMQDEEIKRLTLHPKITYLCAAETNLRRCEAEPVETRKLNVGQTIKLARHLHDAGSEIVFLSSNLVFDGTKPLVQSGEPPSPQTEYGRQKAEAEEILRNELPRVAIVRLTKVVHSRFALFQEWWSAVQQGRTIRPFSDMHFSPVDLALVTEELWALSHSFRPGIFQLSGASDISYASAARLLAETRGMDSALVHPQTTVQAKFSHYFPQHTVLEHKPVRSENKSERSQATLERIFRGLSIPN